jgi:hypothetical protein
MTIDKLPLFPKPPPDNRNIIKSIRKKLAERIREK